MSQELLRSRAGERICAHFEMRTGIRFDPSRQAQLQSRLEPMLRSLGLADLSALERALTGTDADHVSELLVDALTVHETSWFRDPAMFKALETEVLPSLIADRIGRRKLRIWSAGCSTGQEPYSLAIMLDKYFPRLQAWDVQIFANDVSVPVARYAQAGSYSQLEVNRGLSARDLRSYFRHELARWVIERPLRDRVVVRSFNLASDWALFEQFDLVLLRNVLIYLPHERRDAVIRRVRRHMLPGAFLCLGSAELTAELGRDDFQPVEHAGQVLLRKPI